MNSLCKYQLKMVKENIVNKAIDTADITTAEDVVKMLNAAIHLADRPQEEVWVVYLNASREVIGIEMISKGTIVSSFTNPSDVYRGAVKMGAFAIIMAHNHPSGNLTPSKDDIISAKALVKAGKIMCIRFVDSLILGRNDSFTSIRQSCPEVKFEK